MAASSDAGYMMSTPRRPAAFPSSSSARPRAPPSESNIGGPSDDEGDGFYDDQVPNKVRRGGTEDIPRVEDTVGLGVQSNFERFIEEYEPAQMAPAHATCDKLTRSTLQIH